MIRSALRRAALIGTIKPGFVDDIELVAPALDFTSPDNSSLLALRSIGIG
jgi:hypothetical protein